MVRFIDHEKILTADLLKGKRVLELGSGTGVVGIAAALLGTLFATLQLLLIRSQAPASRSQICPK